MSDERAPEFLEQWRVFDAMVDYSRELIGPAATYDVEEGGAIGLLYITPSNPRARAINVITEQWLIVTVGPNGGRFELGFTDADIALAKGIVAATVAGRIEERSALGRSRVVATLEGGKTIHETGHNGCATLLVPQPGWTRWGKLTTFEPYGV